MIQEIKKQYKHNYIDPKIKDWLDLHFPEETDFDGRVFLGYHRANIDGLYTLTCRNVGELQAFISNMHFSNKLDYYITPNLFSGAKRDTDGLFALQNIVIDIDCHGDAAATPTELAQLFVGICANELWDTDVMPEPNSIVYTGRGVQLWWAYAAVSVQLDWIIRQIQNWYMDLLDGIIKENSIRLEGLEIDRAAAKRLAGWFRLPLTNNTKGKVYGELRIRKTERYTHQELYDMVPEQYRIRDKKQKKMETDAAIIPVSFSDAQIIKNTSSGMSRRVCQLLQLRTIRDSYVGEEYRDLYCLAVYCALRSDYSHDQAWDKLLQFNNGFADPLSENELEQMMSTAAKKQYKLTNKWIIDALHITEKEQDIIGLHPVSGKKEFRQERKSNYTRDLVRKISKESRNTKIVELYESGMSKSAIAKELEISRPTVIKVIQEELNKQELAEQDVYVEEIQQIELQAVSGSEYTTDLGGSLSKNGALLYLFRTHEGRSPSPTQLNMCSLPQNQERPKPPDDD